jgi:hypothetical protein
MSLIRQIINQDPDDSTRLGEFDNKFKVPIYITIEHHKIHKGDAFERHIDSGNAAVASLEVAFKTLSGSKLAHILFGFGSSDEILFQIYEGATWDASSGTALTGNNNNRDNGSASTVLLEDTTTGSFNTAGITKDPTNSAGGTLIEQQYTYNAGIGAAVSAESRHAGHEWVLKDNTTYLIKMTQTGGNCKMSIDLHWYEHTDE